MNDFDDKVLLRIFSKLMDWHCKNNNYTNEVGRALDSSVIASVEIFKRVKDHLRPTPAKSHYLYNVRDLSRII